MLRNLLLGGLVLLTACASGREQAAATAPANQVRLCVANRAAGYGSQVKVAYSGGQFVVEAGREGCHTLRGAGPTILVQAVSNGGGSGGPLRVSEAIPTGSGDCWHWELYGPGTARLLRCDERPR